jgi:hypothetical protein
VSRARHIFDESNKAAEIWSKAVMAPVFAQIREHKLMMDQRVQNLRKIHQSLKHLNVRINELEAAKKRLEDQQRASRGILAKIEQPMPPASEANHAAEDEAPTEERTRDEAATEELATARGAA